LTRNRALLALAAASLTAASLAVFFSTTSASGARRSGAPTAAGASQAAAAAPKTGPEWTSRDSLAAARILDALIHRPESVDSLTAGSPARDHDLGFGYRLREAWIDPAGLLGFALKIVHEGNRPVSFEAVPVMNYAGLLARYRETLAPAFTVEGGGGRPLTAKPYHWNLAAVSAPLPADSLKLGPDSPPAASVREAFAYYMSPYSGTLYGIRGGEAGQMLENRDRFLGLAEILMADKRLARYLLRSINPATRLTAAEFIYRRKESFPDIDSLERTAFRAAFANPAKAATMRGGLESREDARGLVLEYAGKEARRDGRGVLRMY
jgi:hypothetical protein